MGSENGKPEQPGAAIPAERARLRQAPEEQIAYFTRQRQRAAKPRTVILPEPDPEPRGSEPADNQ